MVNLQYTAQENLNTLNVALDKLIMDLNRRSQLYRTYSKHFKFCMDLLDNNMESIYLESRGGFIYDCSSVLRGYKGPPEPSEDSGQHCELEKRI